MCIEEPLRGIIWLFFESRFGFYHCLRTMQIEKGLEQVIQFTHFADTVSQISYMPGTFDSDESVSLLANYIHYE